VVEYRLTPDLSDIVDIHLYQTNQGIEFTRHFGCRCFQIDGVFSVFDPLFQSFYAALLPKCLFFSSFCVPRIVVDNRFTIPGTDISYHSASFYR
jgi:hypothetical protein